MVILTDLFFFFFFRTCPASVLKIISSPRYAFILLSTHALSVSSDEKTAHRFVTLDGGFLAIAYIHVCMYIFTAVAIVHLTVLHNTLCLLSKNPPAAAG